MDPTLINAPLAPKVITCPGDYTKFKSACFKFGSHSSYEAAKVSCENSGAKLISIDSTFAKYIRDQVRTMGGNDFWIGSFVNRGRVYRQKGRTSCPIMRGQMINDALYGLVDCNSANRYICQKYGPEEEPESPVGGDMSMGGRPSLASTMSTTTEKVEAEEDGGLSPVIYVVITICILIAALVALKIIIGRYFRDKKNAKPTKAKGDSKKETESVGKGQVFSPKWRKDAESKTTSLDSAVPPSNFSTTLEKPNIDNLKNDPEDNNAYRMERPRVNGAPSTTQPSEIYSDGRYGLTRYKEKVLPERGPNQRRHRRTHSDPRSEYSEYGLDRRPRRRSSYHSDYSHSVSESESDDSSYSGHRYGPKKVFQRQASRNGIGRGHLHCNMDPSYYGPPRRDNRHRNDEKYHGNSKHYGRSQNNHIYRKHDRGDYGRYRSHREEPRSGHYGGRERTTGKRQSKVPTLSAKVQNHTMHRQYFPDPHRLVSWNNMNELDGPNTSAERLVTEQTRSFPREPIRVSRQIYHHMPKFTAPQTLTDFANGRDDDHFYEPLGESKRSKQLKGTSERSKNKKQREKCSLQRASHSRASARSAASIQSRKLPTPPV